MCIKYTSQIYLSLDVSEIRKEHWVEKYYEHNTYIRFLRLRQKKQVVCLYTALKKIRRFQEFPVPAKLLAALVCCFWWIIKGIKRKSSITIIILLKKENHCQLEKACRKRGWEGSSECGDGKQAKVGNYLFSSIARVCVCFHIDVCEIQVHCLLFVPFLCNPQLEKMLDCSVNSR